MENTEDYFLETEFNKHTKEILNNFVKEFEKIFGKYVTKDEVIRRIKENLKFNIEFEDIKKENTLGYYTGDKIVISKDMQKQKKESVAFHELIHCITKHDDCVGFEIEYVDDDYELKIVTAHGLSEGFTQLATKIRDEQLTGQTITGNSYPVLSQQTQNLVKYIGKDKFFNMAFNNPQDLNNVLQEAFPNFDDTVLDSQDLLYAFDEIWKKEETLITDTPEKRILNAIFGRTEMFCDRELNNSVKLIIDTLCSNIYTKNIDTIEDFNEIYSTIEEYNEQLGVAQFSTFEPLFKKLREKEKNNEIDVTDAEEEYSIYAKMDDMMNSDKNAILENICNFNIQDIIEDSQFKQSYQNMVINKLYDNCIIDNVQERYAMLESGIASIILDNGYDLDDISVEKIKLYDKNISSDVVRNINARTVYNLYSGISSDKKYIGTYYDNSDELDMISVIELKPINIENKEQYCRDYDIDSNNIVLVDSEENMFIYSQDGLHRLRDIYGDEYFSDGSTEYFPSKNEEIIKKMNTQIELINSMKEGLGDFLPDLILTDHLERLTQLSNLSSKKFIPEDIEKLTNNVKLKQIEKIMNELNYGKTNQELFERGVESGR